MSHFIKYLWVFAFTICPLAALLFVVRLAIAPFSTKISAQMCRHPVLHTIWAGFAFVGMVAIWFVLNPEMWPPRFVERREQRQKVLARVQCAGGWEALQLGCETLVTNYPNGLAWFPPRTNVWVYPNPQTEPHRYYITNLDYGPLPPAVAALQPRAIRFDPPKFFRSFKDEPQVPVVHINIFGMHSTGGHSTPFFGLEVACGTNAASYRPPPTQGGVSGNRHNNYNRVTDTIYEIY